MKVAICSDIHWCKSSSLIRGKGSTYSLRLENCIKSVDWFERLAEKNKCDAEYFLGDFFDRADLNSEEITALKEVRWSSVPKYFLTGNHEANAASLDFTATNVFIDKDAEIISDVKKIVVNDFVDFYFIPYITEDSFKPLSEYFSGSEGKKKVVFTHNVLAGVNYGRYVSTTGFDVEDILKNCTLFIDGHLHNGGVMQNRIVIAGNLTGLNFNEDANKFRHYAYILDVEDDKISFEPVENPEAFNFYKVNISSEKDIQASLYGIKNAVMSVSCDVSLKDAVTDAFNACKNVVAFKLSVTYKATGDLNDFDSFKSDDPLSQFIAFANTKIDASPVLTEELAILGGFR